MLSFAQVCLAWLGFGWLDFRLVCFALLSLALAGWTFVWCASLCLGLIGLGFVSFVFASLGFAWCCSAMLPLAVIIFDLIRFDSPHLVAEEHALEHGARRDNSRLGSGRQPQQVQLFDKEAQIGQRPGGFIRQARSCRG